MKKAAPIAIFISITIIIVGCYIFSYAITPDEASQDSFLENFWPALNNSILTATLIVVAYYTYETYELRKTAIESNELSMRPIIVFLASEPLFQIENKGAGAAINACLALWRKNQFIVTPSQQVCSALPAHSKHKFEPTENMDSAALKKSFPEYAETIERITTLKHDAIICFYRDIFENNLYSIVNGENVNYRSAFEHGNLGKV